MIVYLITNTINEKKYVGQTTQSLQKRWRGHAHNLNDQIISRAIAKYGIGAFEISVLQECENIDDLNIAEKEWIEKLDTLR